MPNHYTRFISWNYNPSYQGSQDLYDPRFPLIKYTGWKKINQTDTEYRTPEPDNYNRAVFADKPQDCELIEDQVFYYDQEHSAWMSLYYIPDELTPAVDAWIKEQKPWAVWCHLKPPRVKPERGLLWTRHNISDDNMTDNERLYTLGYYKNLKVKYFDDDPEYVDSLLGTARAVLNNPIPEELDEVEDL